MKHQCAFCQSIFRDEDALCENWEDPNRNFICPVCKNYLRRGEPGKPTLAQRLGNVRGRHLLWLVAFVLAMLLLSRRSSLPPEFPYVASLLALLFVVIRGWFSVEVPSPTAKAMVAERVPDSAELSRRGSAKSAGKVVSLFSPDKREKH